MPEASVLALGRGELAGPWAMGWHMAWQLRGSGHRGQRQTAAIVPSQSRHRPDSADLPLRRACCSDCTSGPGPLYESGINSPEESRSQPCALPYPIARC